MGLFNFRKGKTSIPPGATFSLTQRGVVKVQDFGGDDKSRILTALESRGTSDIDEIAGASGLNRGKVERLIPSMVRSGYIQYVSAASAGISEE